MARQLLPRAPLHIFKPSQTPTFLPFLPRCPQLSHPPTPHHRTLNQRRCYSNPISKQEASLKTLPDIDPSLLSITNTTTPKKILEPQDLIFGRTFTDHMLSIEWTAASGWLAPQIVPYQNLSLDPATCVFHYAFECFEGMKAYRHPSGEISLFRPDRNMRRLNRSASRIALPTFDGTKLTELIKTLVKLDERFIPTYAQLRHTPLSPYPKLTPHPPAPAATPSTSAPP